MTSKRIGLVSECGEALFEHMLCTGSDEKVFPLVLLSTDYDDFGMELKALI